MRLGRFSLLFIGISLVLWLFWFLPESRENGRALGEQSKETRDAAEISGNSEAIERNTDSSGLVGEDNSWRNRPDLCAATRIAFRRIHFEEGGEERSLQSQEDSIKTPLGQKQLQWLLQEPGRMQSLGMVAIENIDGLLVDLLSFGRTTISNTLTQQRLHFQEMSRAIEAGQPYSVADGMAFNALNYPPESYVHRFTGTSAEDLSPQAWMDLGRIRDRHLRQEALLYQEESLMEFSKREAALETGIMFPDSTRLGWREILPEYDRLELEREQNREQYLEAIRTYLLLNGFPSAGDQ